MTESLDMRGKWDRSTILSRRTVKNCLVCGIEFSRCPAKMEKSKVCSNSCRYIYNGTHNKEINNKPPSRVGVPWKDEQRKKFILAISGEKAPNWKGGIGRWRKRDYIWVQWRKNVFERDDYTCQDCGQSGVILEAHHILTWALNPELRYDVDNGRTLCTQCHKKYLKISWMSEKDFGGIMKKIGGLWLKKKKDGKSFFSGSINFANDEKMQILIFKNDYKQGNQPDYNIFEGEPREKSPEPVEEKESTEGIIPF